MNERTDPDSGTSSKTQPDPDSPPLRFLEGRRGYLPISDYAVIGDTRTAALVARDGAIDWFCGPDFDGDPLFGRLLDQFRGGTFYVGPVPDPDRQTTARRVYEDYGPILTTTHASEAGGLKVTDFMNLPDSLEEAASFGRSVVRLFEATEGAADVEICIAPRCNYALSTPEFIRRGPGSWQFTQDGDIILIDSSIELEIEGSGRLNGRGTLATGERGYVTLTVTQGGHGHVGGMQAAQEALAATREAWRKRQSKTDFGDGPFSGALKRSLLALQLLIHAPTGAVIASPTMGLPEVIGGIRNYDYRYCWLRDAYFVLHAFLDQGLTDEADAFFRWLMAATRETAPELGTLYTVRGDSNVSISSLQTLEGYRRSAPVQLGNGAATQLQLDAYGSMIMAARAYVEAGGELHPGEGIRLANFADVVVSQWTRPDNGIWEMPNPRRHHTYSKAMCWGALDGVISLAENGVINADTRLWKAERAAIEALIREEAWNEEIGAFTGAIGEEWLDSSVLLMPRIGVIPADDPKMAATYTAIRERLGTGVHLRRYDVQEDGMPGIEGHFNVCGFWAADYLVRAGRLDDARTQIEGMLKATTDLGLMSEEHDPESGAQLGNFPQGLSHAGMIAAITAYRGAVKD
ncbi:glycoside hydrolase family 15 protein [Thioclava sp. NG1]|uniref:glycoside hydrolase family 15 protein n=1 Tax=Thioclava sp. NG1 TaxID=2182426 RepID=UPI000D6112FE|nr:glycoside hydrolase family 15 protein [Thioclava sp. NG1]PWE50335.1 glycoside hydrolase family 15 protein [Thioclava sp. NG1]